MRQHRTVLLGLCTYSGLVALCFVLWLTGCAGRPATAFLVSVDGGANTGTEASPGASPGLPASMLAALPPLPSDAPASAAAIRARRAAAVGGTGLYGSQVFMLSQNNASVDGLEHSCLLDSANNQVSWAMYAFPNLLPEDLPLSFSLRTLGEQMPSPCYVAIADYGRGAWDWTELSVGQQEYNVGVGAGQAAISPGGNLYIVAATFNGGTLAIGGLNLELNCAAPPPAGFLVEPGDGVQTPVVLSWVDPALSFDPDGEGPLVFLYDVVLVERALSADGPWDVAAQLQPGTTSFDDPLSIGGNPPPEGGFYYHLMTLISGASPVTGVSRFGGIELTPIQLEAKFTVSPLTGDPGVEVAFDGSGSIVVGGTLTAVKWDFEGDGTWDLTSASVLTASHTYADAGRFYPRLMLVMDTGGGIPRTDIVTGYFAVGDKRGDWSQWGRNSMHNNRSPMRGPKAAHVAGSYTASSTLLNPAIGADGKVYIPAASGWLEIFNPDCSLEREINLGGGLASSPPAIDSAGNMWINVKDGSGFDRLLCVKVDNTVQTYPPAMMTGRPVIAPDGLYVLAPAKSYLAMATPEPPPGGSYWWTKSYSRVSSTTMRTPAVSADGYVYAVWLDGVARLPWRAPGGGLLPLWIKDGLGFSDMHDASVNNDGRAFVPKGVGGVKVLTTTGTAVAGFSTADPGGSHYSPVGSPAFAIDGTTYVSTKEGRVFAFTPAGAIACPFYELAGAEFVSSPAIDGNGNLFLLTKAGQLISLTRKLVFKWSFSLGAPCQSDSLAIGNDGTLYVGGTNKLYAFK